MLFSLFEPGKPWFRAKRYGVGAGLPIAREGWLLLGSYFAVIVGLAALAPSVEDDAVAIAIIVAVMVAATVVLVLIARAHTEGGWRWRWGDDD